MLRKLIFIALTLATFHSVAWEARVSTEYVLGDGDSRIVASKHAREALMIKAASQGETYVQTTTRLEGEQLSEVVKVLGASMVRITDYDEHFKLNQAGATVLVATAMASVDEDELQSRIERAQADASVQDELYRLSMENRRLRVSLEKARAMRTPDSLEDLEGRLADLNRAFGGLASNRASVDEIFAKGTLVAFADTYEAELDRAKSTIQEKVIEEIMETDVEVKVDSVQQSNGGYSAQVMLDWDLDVTKFRKILSPWLQVGRDRYGRLLIQNPSSAVIEASSALSEDLYAWLSRQQIDVVVGVEGETVSVPLLYSAYSFMGGTCGPRLDAVGSHAVDDYFVRSSICMARVPGRGEEFAGTELENPVALPLTKAQAIKATTVDLDVRWRQL